MQQIVFSGEVDVTNSTATEYIAPINMLGNYWDATEANHLQIVPSNCKIKRLMIQLGNSPGAGTSYAFTMRKGLAATALTTTIADTDTEGIDATNEVSFSAGDFISLQCVPTGTPATRVVRWSFILETDDDDVYAFIGGTVNALSISTNEFNTPSGGDYWGIEGVISVAKRSKCVVDGTLQNLYIALSGSPGAGNSYVFTVRINGVNSALTCTVADTATTANDTSNTVSVSAGDNIDIRCSAVSSPTLQYAAWGMEFAVDDQTNFPICAVTRNPLNRTATEYNNLTSTVVAWNATEGNVKVLGQASRLSRLYVELDAAPGSGNQYEFTVMKDSVATALQVTITDTNTTGNDTTNFVEVDDWELLSLRCIPTSNPTSVEARWGLIVEPLATDRKSLKLTGMGL